MNEPKDIAAKLQTFQKYGQALTWVAGGSCLFVIILLALERCAWWHSVAPGLLQEPRGERLLFISYVFVLVAMWAVYFFLSASKKRKVKTLRNLLSLTSEIFQREKLHIDDNTGDLLASALREKARTSITMLAMLTAAAILMFTRSLDLVYLDNVSQWQKFMGYCSAGAAIVAAICFVISADSFDVMYNVFGAPGSVERAHMLQFFYRSTRNTRYYGVMFLLWAVCLFAGARSPLFGAVVIGLVVSIGWSHWFPSPALIGGILNPSGSKAAVVLRVGFICFPIAWPLLSSLRFFFDRGLMVHLQNSPDYLFAVGSAVLWAMSSQVVRSALEKIPNNKKWPSIIPGLLLSLCVGCFSLFAFARGNVTFASLSLWTVAAGVLLFPVGTGLYYLCSHAFGGRVEFASQFSNVKPIFSVAFAFAFLGEVLSSRSAFVLVLIVLGVIVLLCAVRRGTFNVLSLILGLLLAAVWGGGEALAKLGIASGPSLEATFWALVSGTAIAAVVAVPVMIVLRGEAFIGIKAWAPQFMLHGLLSFAFAYALLFESISRIGVAQTALINAFWPSLAIIISRFKQREDIPWSILLASIFLFVGSLIQVTTIS